MLQSVQIVSFSLVRFRDQTAWHQDLANFPAVFLNSCHGAESRSGTISWVGEWLNQERDLYYLVSVTVFFSSFHCLCKFLASPSHHRGNWGEIPDSVAPGESLDQITAPELSSDSWILIVLHRSLSTQQKFKFFTSREILSLTAPAQCWHSFRFNRAVRSSKGLATSSSASAHLSIYKAVQSKAMWTVPLNNIVK